MEQSTSFKEAYLRLKEINEILKNDVIMDVDEIIKLQNEATTLYNICKNKLENFEQ
ncbi:MAG: exodeoxyribonuclease VII small subunit [Candidatus Absconditabacteria bacterium]